MHSNSNARVISHLNLLITKRNLKNKIQINFQSLRLIKTLHSVGCVNKFLLTSQLKKKLLLPYVHLSVPFYKNTPFFKSIRLISTPSKKHRISLSSLNLLNKTLKASILILSTDRGIITHREALKLKVGGLALCMVH
jgi:ribosomal protein S8